MASNDEYQQRRAFELKEEKIISYDFPLLDLPEGFFSEGYLFNIIWGDIVNDSSFNNNKTNKS